MLASCDSGKDPELAPESKQESKIEWSVQSVSLAAQASTISVNMTATGVWAVSGSTSWCTVTPASGAKGSSSLTITVTENTGDSERRESLVAKSGTASATLVVVQKAKSSLTITSDKQEVAQAGGTFEIEIKANVDYDVVIPTGTPWLKHSSTKAIATHKVLILAEANAEYEKREGMVIIKEKEGKLSDTVRVYQAQKDAIVLTQNQYNIPTNGGNISIEIKSNVEYEVGMPDAQWLSIASTKALSSHTVEVVVKPNETYDVREAVIAFTNKNASLKEEVKIIQSPVGVVIITKKQYEVPAEGGVVDVPLQRNVELELEIKDGWLHLVNTKGVEEDQLSFQVDANPTYNERIGTVIISGTGMDVKDTLTVVQSQKTLVGVETKEYSISDKGGVFSVAVKSNDEVNISIPESCAGWLRQSATKTIVTRDYSFEADTNPNFEERNGVIYFYHSSLEDGDTLYVTQKANTGLKLSYEMLAVENTEGESNFTFMAGADWTVTCNAQWCEITPTSGSLGTNEILIKRQENKQYGARQATINISTSEVSATLILTQKERPNAPKNGIRTYEQLAAFRDAVNAGKDYSPWKDENGVVNLIADIVMPYKNKYWVPINAFGGTFDGNGFTIDSMYVSRDYMAGLFSSIVSGGIVRNVIIDKDCLIFAEITENDYTNCTGAICGYNKGTIENCENNTFYLYGCAVGGICGVNVGTIIDCQNKGSIYSPTYGGDEYYSGGICAMNGGIIRNCTNKATGYGLASAIGGIVGWNEGHISSSNNYGEIVSTYSGSNYKTSAGGIAAYMVGKSALIAGCTNAASITGYLYTGGIAGYNGGGDSGYGTVQNSGNTGKIIANGKQGGGVVGINYCGDVQNCTNKGEITEAMYAGGIAGVSEGTSSKMGKIDKCTNDGPVLASSVAGGVCGYNRNYSRITESSNSAKVESMGNYAGGVCGYNESNGVVYNCTNTGSVKSSKYSGDISGNDSPSAVAPQAAPATLRKSARVSPMARMLEAMSD